MRFPIAIQSGGDAAAFGVVVPDLPGCFWAGDSIDEAVIGAEEAIAAWIDATLDSGGSVPTASSLDAIRGNPEFRGWTFAIVSVDPAVLDDVIERIDVVLPRRVLRRLDALAQAAGQSRSDYIANLTLK